MSFEEQSHTYTPEVEVPQASAESTESIGQTEGELLMAEIRQTIAEIPKGLPPGFIESEVRQDPLSEYQKAIGVTEGITTFHVHKFDYENDFVLAARVVNPEREIDFIDREIQNLVLDARPIVKKYLEERGQDIPLYEDFPESEKIIFLRGSLRKLLELNAEEKMLETIKEDENLIRARMSLYEKAVLCDKGGKNDYTVLTNMLYMRLGMRFGDVENPYILGVIKYIDPFAESFRSFLQLGQKPRND
jgi:hypothetical protein